MLRIMEILNKPLQPDSTIGGAKMKVWTMYLRWGMDGESCFWLFATKEDAEAAATWWNANAEGPAYAMEMEVGSFDEFKKEQEDIQKEFSDE